MLDIVASQQTPFIFRAMGFNFHNQVTIAKQTHFRPSTILPRPLPGTFYVGQDWYTAHQECCGYYIAHHDDTSPMWKRSKRKAHIRYRYPPGEDGVSETWSFKNFKYMSGCTTRRMRQLYNEIRSRSGRWENMSRIIDEKCASGQLDVDVRDDWDRLCQPFLTESKTFYWERKCINDAILILLALDLRWGSMGISGSSH